MRSGSNEQSSGRKRGFESNLNQCVILNLISIISIRNDTVDASLKQVKVYLAATGASDGHSKSSELPKVLLMYFGLELLNVTNECIFEILGTALREGEKDGSLELALERQPKKRLAKPLGHQT